MIVITGIGAVTPLGQDVGQTWEGLLAGRSGVRAIEAFDASGFPTRFAAQIGPLRDPSDGWADAHRRWADADLLDRKTALALLAAEEAWTQAGGVRAERNGNGVASSDRVGVCLGSEGGRRLLEDLGARAGRFRGAPTLQPVVSSLPPGEWARLRASHPSRVLAHEIGASGPVLTVSTACTSSGGALAEAAKLLRHGEADIVLAGGTDTLVEAFMLSGFSLLGALSHRNDEPERASRPFDVDRDGFVLGEGAGALVLEREDHAFRRGARVLGRLLGAGMSNNAWRITDSPPNGGGPALAMLAALHDARLRPEDVGYINAHGTSTQMNDLSETRGIRRALGGHADRVAVSSCKSMIGHLVAACGAVEAIATVLALRDGVLPPTLNLETPDPGCDLDYVPKIARRMAGLRAALTNSFGFGGSNATIALGAA